jgi:acyl-CoA synthetase (AMP-forming)/AMP-acid ligase II
MKYNILDYFHNTVKKTPNKVAIIEGDNHITFQDLELKTKILAKYLVSNLDEKNKPIAIYLPKSIQSVIANIAITYSANIYMHLDIKNPSERLLNILNLIQPRIIITNSIYSFHNVQYFFKAIALKILRFKSSALIVKSS